MGTGHTSFDLCISAFFPSNIISAWYNSKLFFASQSDIFLKNFTLQGTVCDVREGKDVEALVAYAKDKLNYIDIWVCALANWLVAFLFVL